MTSMKIFRVLKSSKYCVLLFESANVQARCKSHATRPKAFVTNRYQKTEEAIGLYGYCLLAVPIVTFTLGTWQIKRWWWKLDLIDKLQKRTSAEPVELPFDLNKLEDMEYYRVKMNGTFLYEKEFLMGPRSLIVDGQALSEKGGGVFSQKSNTGYYVITPFKLEDRDLTIMVNRGWIPKSARSTFKQENKIVGTIEIVGNVRTGEKRPPFVPANTPTSGVWHYRDLDAMAQVAEAEPIYIELSVGYGTPGGPIGGQTRITLRNEHLSYIVTWYGLCASTGYIWFRHFMQKLPVL